MKTKIVLALLILVVISTACTGTATEEQMQTAIAVALQTSAASDLQQEESASSEELARIEAELEAAIAALTQQAEEISELEIQLLTEQAPPTITPTLTPTLTPNPRPTPTWGLPENQKQVVATGKTPLYHFTKKNDQGYPIMVKTSPVIRIEDGEWFLIYTKPIRADGGSTFYEIAGPVHKGYYVQVGTFRDIDK
ncbi:hypothetical protein ACFLYP_02910 [Chloroflexota bacterium]